MCAQTMKIWFSSRQSRAYIDLSHSAALYGCNSTTSLPKWFQAANIVRRAFKKMVRGYIGLLPCPVRLSMARNLNFRHTLEVKKCRCSRPYAHSVVTIGGVHTMGDFIFSWPFAPVPKRQKNYFHGRSRQLTSCYAPRKTLQLQYENVIASQR